jgi:hypothetical protein
LEPGKTTGYMGAKILATGGGRGAAGGGGDDVNATSAVIPGSKVWKDPAGHPPLPVNPCSMPL